MCYLTRLRANIANTLIPSVHPSPRQECVCGGICFVPTKGERGEYAGWWRQKKKLWVHSCLQPLLQESKVAHCSKRPDGYFMTDDVFTASIRDRVPSSKDGRADIVIQCSLTESVRPIVLDLRLNIYRVCPNASRVANLFFLEGGRNLYETRDIFLFNILYYEATLNGGAEGTDE